MWRIVRFDVKYWFCSCPVQTKLKNTLKLSTKSVIHNADDIVKSKSVSDVGKRISNISAALKGTEKMSYVGIALGAIGAGNNIHDACKVNGTGECRKVATIEAIGLTSSVAGGAIAGKVGVVVGGTALVIIGVTSAPVIAVSVSASALIGSVLGGSMLVDLVEYQNVQAY